MKKNLVVINVFLLGILSAFIYVQGYDGPKFCILIDHSDRCFYLYQVIRDTLQVFMLAFLPITVLVCLFREIVVRTWWKFARIAIPIILVISTLINLQLHHSSGGFMNMDDMFDIPALILIYTVFILGSLIQIWRGYKQK